MAKKIKSGFGFSGLLTASIVIVVGFLVVIQGVGISRTTNPTNAKAASDRPRVQVVNGIPVTGDTKHPLRGENPRLFPVLGFSATSDTMWKEFRDKFNLNIVRILNYREPITVSDTACKWDCQDRADQYKSASDFDTNKDNNLSDSELTGYRNYIMTNRIPLLDDWVNYASKYGFYAIIDYHPVGGYDEFDSREWWKIIAPRYKDRTHVLYEIVNEPVAWEAAKYLYCNPNFSDSSCPGTISSERTRDTRNRTALDHQVSLYKLVRSLAPNTHMILWSFANASGPMSQIVQLGADKGINYSNTSVGIHIYGRSFSEITNLKNKCKALGCGVIPSEMGFRPDAPYDTKIAYVENLGLQSWIILDGTREGRPLTVTWPKDCYFTTCGGGGTQPTNTPTPTSASPSPTRTPPTPTPSSTPIPSVSPSIRPSPTFTPSPSPTVVIDPPIGLNNVLPNSLFSSDPNEDYFFRPNDGTSTFTWATDQFYSSSRSLKATYTGTDSSLMTRWMTETYSMPAIPGKTYTGKVWVRTSGVVNNANLTVLFLEPNNLTFVSGKTSTGIKGTNGWQEITVSATAPTSSSLARFEMRLIGPGTVWWDNASLVIN